MNPLEPLPEAASGSAPLPWSRWRAVWTLLGAEVVGSLAFVLLSGLTCGFCGVGAWIQPFLSAAAWGTLFAERHPGASVRGVLLPVMVSTAFLLSMMALGNLASVAATLADPGSQDESPGVLAFQAVAQMLWIGPQPLAGATVGLALVARRTGGSGVLR